MSKLEQNFFASEMISDPDIAYMHSDEATETAFLINENRCLRRLAVGIRKDCDELKERILKDTKCY